ncbi:uncharacterized protein LOC119720433 [Patiria miniata]|uniref:CCHC-type domain-containing protein n=1 Tax=Patiria miniata TaxID=46514 RepID=A0A913Z5H3_PATMI|nr:uncharacterized protein LOC119720433 [Patiria miniata]
MAVSAMHRDRAMEVQFEEQTAPKSLFTKLHDIGVVAKDHLAAIQPLPGNKFEIVYKSSVLCKEFYPKVTTLDKCTVTKFNDVMIVTVHYVSLSMHDSIVRNILGRYGQVIAGRFTTYGDNPTVFNGTRQYRMRINKPIPTVIRIGDRNAWISYPGQIRTCARCGQEGHFAKECNNIKCFKCLQVGHIANECPNSTVCTICGEEGHGFRACPKSFANKVQPDRAWSTSSSTPSAAAPPAAEERPARESPRSEPSEPDKELPITPCSKCKRPSGPFHPSICCFSCKSTISCDSPFRVLECALCKGMNGPPSLVCDREDCRNVQAPERDDGFRLARKKKRPTKRARSPQEAPSSKRATPTTTEVFGSDLESVSSMDSTPPKEQAKTGSSSASNAGSSSSSSSSDASSESEQEQDSTDNDEASGVNPMKIGKVLNHLTRLKLPGLSEPARCRAPKCLFTCQTWSGLSRHTSSVHNDSSLTQVKCPWCPHSACLPTRWTRHIARQHPDKALRKKADFFKKYL